MILAGVAVIGGIVAARQPALHTANTAQTSITVSTAQQVSFEPAIFTGINDEKLDPSELEAHFISHGNMMNSQYIQPVFTDGTIMGIDMELTPLSVDENGDADPQITAENNADIYWIDGKPYEVKIQNEMKQKNDIVNLIVRVLYTGQIPTTKNIMPISGMMKSPRQRRNS